MAVAREATITKIGTYSSAVTRNGTNGQLGQIVSAEKGITYFKGRTFTYGAWVYATEASRVRLLVYDGSDTFSSYHTGDSTWQWLTVTRTVSTGATFFACYLSVYGGDTTGYIDGAMLVEGSSAFAFSPKPAEEGVWADYFATSTIVGWAAGKTGTIYTKKIGKTVFVSYEITGTSNATSATFTVPYTIATPSMNSMQYAVDNGGTAVSALATASASGVIINLYSDAAGSAWTGSGTKTVAGSFFYEAA